MLEKMSRLPGDFFSAIALCKFEHRKLDIANTLTARGIEQT